jgi:hypothetical protein
MSSTPLLAFTFDRCQVCGKFSQIHVYFIVSRADLGCGCNTLLETALQYRGRLGDIGGNTATQCGLLEWGALEMEYYF